MKSMIWSMLLVAALMAACGKTPKAPEGVLFKDDVAFLKAHTSSVILSGQGGLAQVAVNPDLQGRVMTSTAGGSDGFSFGWINRELIASGQNNLHMNGFGGEDRFWLGPEGGQFSVFFKKDDPFDLEHWFTPPPINEGAYDVVNQEAGRIHFRKAMHLVNYSGTGFDLELNRIIRLLGEDDVRALGIPAPKDLKIVAFASENSITNTGSETWAKDTGLLSVWILGMFNPSPETTIVIPFKPGPAEELGPAVNDTYFGKVPADRLIVKDGLLFFRGDGMYRSKIGISPRRIKPFAGSYDASKKVLTVILLTVTEGVTDYVNSMWETQENPFGGDVVNSYNDGPPAPGAKPLGPFYELESSSPAAALNSGETLTHVHTTIHFQGKDGVGIEEIARTIFGVGIEEIEKAFKKD